MTNKPETKTFNTVDDAIDFLIDHNDPIERVKGRLLATGITETIREWLNAEMERGTDIYDALNTMSNVLVGLIALHVGTLLREDMPQSEIEIMMDQWSRVCVTTFRELFPLAVRGT